MARYIDADKLLEELNEELMYESTMFSKEQEEYLQNGIRIAIGDVKRFPAADVVPKSEVDRLKAVMKEMDEQRAYTINMLGESLEKAKSEVERWRRNLEAVLEERAEEKADVAREIFAEIEKWLVHEYVPYIRGYSNSLSRNLAELKKKYTEQKND